ncbi:hypothetical protein ACK8P5_05510 [Paenibacillus sp. EC2-1]|uniref:hypothetical protein n=1 Tax=Paenibacillus sp. EC2-1 TaxID=3388665 RepID=UPI003BEF15D1
MEFSFGNAAIVLPPLHITIIGIIIIFLLVRWSKQLETRRFTVFIYFLICTTIMPVFSYATTEGIFQLFIPIGFMAVFPYLYRSESYHSSKMKASILGFLIALYQLFHQYMG